MTDDKQKKIVSLEEVAAMLERGEISVEDYVQAIESAIGKETFWKIYNEHLKNYFTGIDFNDSSIRNSILKAGQDENK